MVKLLPLVSRSTTWCQSNSNSKESSPIRSRRIIKHQEGQFSCSADHGSARKLVQDKVEEISWLLKSWGWSGSSQLEKDLLDEFHASQALEQLEHTEDKFSS